MIRQLVEAIVVSIVDHPLQVAVSEANQESGAFIIKIRLAQNDLGKVIGHHGQIIKAIRAIAQVLNTSGQRIDVDVAAL